MVQGESMVNHDPMMGREHDESGKTNALIAVGAAGILAGGAFLLGGTVLDGGRSEADASRPASAKESLGANVVEACPDGVSLDSRYVDGERGTDSSPYPTLAQRKNENDTVTYTLVSRETAQERTQANNCSNAATLALAKTVFIDPRDRAHLPDEKTLARAVANYQAITTDTAQAKQSLIKVTDAFVSPDFLVPTDSFAVTKGQATSLEVITDDKGNVTGLKSEEITTTGTLEGFQVGYDEEAITDADDRALYDKLQDLALITTDGKIVINRTLGEDTVRFDDKAEQTAKPKEDKQNPAPAQQNPAQQNENGTSSVGPNEAENPAGTNQEEEGCGGSGCGGGSGDTNGQGGGSGDGSGGGGGCDGGCGGGGETPTPNNPQPTPNNPQPTPNNPQPTPNNPQPTPTPTPTPSPTPTPPGPTKGPDPGCPPGAPCE